MVKMKKGGKEFINKFRLLNSQENSQEIIWSSSDSSDYENIPFNKKIEDTKQKIYSRKRKRNGTKIKLLNNISNLDITYDSTATDSIQLANNYKSPILKTKCSSISPILFNTQCFEPSIKNANKSPILSFPHGVQCGKSKSPILILKTKSPNNSPKVRKKLFDCYKQELDMTNTGVKENTQHKNDRDSLQDTKTSRLYVKENFLDSPFENNGDINNIGKENSSDICNMYLDDKSKLVLINKVKSYFDSNLSQETTSLVSISEYESTQNNSRTSEEIENIISLTCDEKTKTEIADEESLDKDNVNKSKKIRFKKDGLAYRLNSLILKQTASISLWNHERFLANNSNFTIPKGDYTAFRIQNVQLKYGCYLIDAKNVNNDSFTIIINISHVNNVTIEKNVLLKLYKPFKCLNVNDRKLIVNVFKFECDKMIRK